ncbi:MAG TPA: hypothetical protein VK424_02030 [Thermoplasmata archaeon]|nr:hypothetical protein [Thermoplasmata archaeon]
MTRSRESGAYLGGIGTMLGETRACDSCGGVHESHPFGFQHRDGHECPALVEKDFAIVSLLDGETDRPETLSDEFSIALPRSDLPVAFGAVPIPSPRDSRSHQRTLEVPWLAPPTLSEVV